MKNIFLYFFIIILCSCSINAREKDKKKPEWLENPEKVYSPQMYLTAIGEGDTRKDAKSMAAANLAKIFKMEVKASENTLQRYEELTKDNKTKNEDFTQIEKNVNIQSNQVLMNVKYADTYTDNLGRVYALAYINRLKTAQIYEQKINNNAAKIDYFLELAKKRDEIKYKYAAYSAAHMIADRNETLIEQLRVIKSEFIDILEISYNQTEIAKQKANFASKITVSISLSNDYENKISNILEEVITDFGFSINEESLYELTGDLNFEKIDLRRDKRFKFVRFHLNLKLTEKDNNHTIITLNEKGREGHVSVDEAKERGIRKLEKELENSFKKKIYAYFDGLVAPKK